tara:strand:+ start:1934 stop:2491 length:558 start_codon:yes stop_codon:yes gene_type:complete
MKNLKDYIKIYDDVLDHSICKQIVESADESKFTKSTVRQNENSTANSGGVIKEDRNCYNKWLDKQFENDVFNSIGKILNLYQNDIGTFADGAEGKDTGYDHLLYKGSEKGKYTTHVDYFSQAPRLLSISILLNNNFDGGNFCFFDEYVIEKKVGSAIAFPSNFMFPHAVLPVSNGDRHSVITWIR